MYACGNNKLAIEGPKGPDHARAAADGDVDRPGGEDAGGHGGHDAVRRVRHRVQSAPDKARGALRKTTTNKGAGLQSTCMSGGEWGVNRWWETEGGGEGKDDHKTIRGEDRHITPRKS